MTALTTHPDNRPPTTDFIKSATMVGMPVNDPQNPLKYYNNAQQLHKENGPAVIYPNGDQEWWLNGHRHRADGPAMTNRNFTAWFSDGKLHNTNGPAIVYSHGIKIWYNNGKLHRENGPAYEDTVTNVYYWFQDGVLNRPQADGPVVDTPIYKEWASDDYKGPGIVTIGDNTTDGIVAYDFKKNILQLNAKITPNANDPTDPEPDFEEKRLIQFLDDDNSIYWHVHHDKTFVRHYHSNQLHRTDGPAFQENDIELWFENNKPKENGLVMREHYIYYYRLNGQLHKSVDGECLPENIPMLPIASEDDVKIMNTGVKFALSAKYEPAEMLAARDNLLQTMVSCRFHIAKTQMLSTMMEDDA
jgi:hypothetical protein